MAATLVMATRFPPELRGLARLGTRLAPSLARFDVDVMGQAEDSLPDDVALHLRRAAADGQRRREQEPVVPHATRPVEHAVRAGEVLRRAHDVLAVLVGQ